MFLPLIRRLACQGTSIISWEILVENNPRGFFTVLVFIFLRVRAQQERSKECSSNAFFCSKTVLCSQAGFLTTSALLTPINLKIYTPDLGGSSKSLTPSLAKD